MVTSVSITLFTQLGMPNGQMALFTSLITFPWVIKPLWSPFVDVIRTKRWWVLLMQALMCVTILLLAWLAPKGYFTWALVFFTITAFASATHDIAADGFYMLALTDKQQATFVGIRSTFYKIANIFCQSLLLMLVGWLQTKTTVATSWTYTLLGCSGLMAGITLWHTFFLPVAETMHNAQCTMHNEKMVRERVETLIGRVGLTPERHKKIGQLSKGYKQRVGLAQALLGDPDLLILDEPTTGLDPNQLVDIRRLIRELGKDRTVILSTHIMQEVREMCDRVVILDHGEIKTDMPIGEIEDLEALFHEKTADGGINS